MNKKTSASLGPLRAIFVAANEALIINLQRRTMLMKVLICLSFLMCLLALRGSAQTSEQTTLVDDLALGSSFGVSPDPVATVLPPVHLRPNVHVNIRDWTHRLSEDIKAVGNRTNCLEDIKAIYSSNGEAQSLDATKLRDSLLNQISTLLSQHRSAVNAIVSEAEKLAMSHNFVKDLRFNYTDVHRIRNELDPNGTSNVDASGQWILDQSPSSSNQLGVGQIPQFTSINGGTPVPGPPEWQTPPKSIIMQVNKNFGDIPVNTSMSAIHLPLPIYAGLPNIMNGIAWTSRLDNVFKRNLANYMHVHHQYYGDHLGFLRTFPAHKWRIPRNEPDLFDARTRPWYVAGANSPKDMVILIDSSGSMTGSRREIAKGVVFELLDTLTNNDFFSVMRFSETVTPIGLPKCNLRTPKLSPTLEEQCQWNPAELKERERLECARYRVQWENRNQYLRDHPNVVVGANGSYLTDEVYRKSIVNVTHEISDAYLLPATSRNIRYLKSNFSMPTAGIANFTHALMAAFELLQAYNRSGDLGAQCNQAIMLITDGAIKSNDEIFNRYNYPNSPVRVFTYMIGREVGDITHTKAMACNNRGYYTHVINLGEVREQVQKYLPVMARSLVLSHYHPISWTYAYGDETHQVLTDWVLETKRRERARIMLNEERERLSEVNSSDVINIELTNIAEYDELPLVDEELKNRIICEDNADDAGAMDQSLQDELDPLGYNDLACHWTSRRADLLTSVVKPVFDTRNASLYLQRNQQKQNLSSRDQDNHVPNAQLLGVAAVDLRIADIIRLAPSHLLGPNGYAILMGPNGFIMHHPDLRALLEDPFDKQSKILKPYFNAVDLSQIEQVQHKNESDLNKKRNDELRLLKLRESAIRRQLGSETVYVKRAIDCKRRLHIRQQVFHYGPIKDTPFSFILALPHNYGTNRLEAKIALQKQTYFEPSIYDLWTLHPDYRYCNLEGTSLTKNSSVGALVELMNQVNSGSISKVAYADLNAINNDNQQSQQQQVNRQIVCDQELFPSLLFDAMATSSCGTTNSDKCDRSFSNFYESREDSCTRNAQEMRSKLANIYGLEMSFLATRSGLTRVKVFDLTARIKKLADLFIKRHNRAVDEPWYERTVDWNMRFHEDATIITVPYNAYIRLIAKLRQRITQRHPAVNDTRANCDPMLDSNYETGEEGAGTENPQSELSNIQNDEPQVSPSTDPSGGEQTTPMPAIKINYNDYSSFDFLDLLTNSSVHISATQSVIVNKGNKYRSPVAVTGLLYDYATFARRFLNATSLNIRVDERDSSQVGAKVSVCPNGECPTRCGDRNDTIDCLLIDNNGFIVVGEELPHIGRPLVDYDEHLMQSLVERRVFHEVQLTDYQAICTRNDQSEPRWAAPAAGQIASSAIRSLVDPFRWELVSAVFTNLAASAAFIWHSLYSLVLFQAGTSDLSETLLGKQYQWQRSVSVDAQSAIANQSLLALLPNKTYLRPCERTITLYETRPTDLNKLTSDKPEYYVSKCGCSGWYVYDAVPKTNLIMVIVNTTLACRKCDPSPPATSNFVPVLPPVDNGKGKDQAQVNVANKTAEDQVCAMLERESQLYVRRQETCYSYHPEEAQINVCGAATKFAPVSNLLITICSHIALIITCWARTNRGPGKF